MREPHSISRRHAKKLLARQEVVAETTQHAAGDEIRPRLVYAAGGHAMMRRLDDHANPLRLEDIVDGVGDLRRHLFLDLQPLGINVHYPASLEMPTARLLGI